MNIGFNPSNTTPVAQRPIAARRSQSPNQREASSVIESLSTHPAAGSGMQAVRSLINRLTAITERSKRQTARTLNREQLAHHAALAIGSGTQAARAIRTTLHTNSPNLLNALENFKAAGKAFNDEIKKEYEDELPACAPEEQAELLQCIEKIEQSNPLVHLASQVMRDGLGHVLWGSRPGYLLTDGEANHILAALQKNQDQDIPLQQSFVILADTEPDANPDVQERTLLVNRDNFRQMMEKHRSSLVKHLPPDLAKIVDEQGKDPDKFLQLLAENKPLFHRLIQKDTFLGTCIGYGVQNSRNFECLYGLNSSLAENTTEAQREALKATKGRSNLTIGHPPIDILTSPVLLPNFAAWPSEETTELLERYGRESEDIKGRVQTCMATAEKKNPPEDPLEHVSAMVAKRLLQVDPSRQTGLDLNA